MTTKTQTVYFDEAHVWSLDEVAALVNSLTLAVPAPRISLLGGDLVYAYLLADDACLITVSLADGEMKRYGVMDADGLAILRERLAPINPHDYEYPCAIAAALGELCHTTVEMGDEPSYDPDADDWDWSDEDKELGIGCYVGGSKR